MNRLLGLVFLIAIAAVVAGFYFGILRIGSDSTGGITHVTLTWDKDKMHEDEKKAMEKAHTLVPPNKEQVEAP